MGMFDTVVFTCPKCGKDVLEQTKAGQCMLAYYPESEVPTEIAYSLEGNVVRCYSCDEAFIVKPEQTFPRTVPMKLVELPIDQDEDE